MSFSRRFHTVLFVITGLLAPVFFTQCKTTASYKDIKYDSSKLKTPAGHGMEKKEYPFDDDGAYRKDWVKNNSGGRTAGSYSRPETATVAVTDDSGPSTYPTYAEASAERETAVSMNVSDPTTLAVSAPVSTTTSARYHKVVTGDTLFALAQRYGTSVDDFRRVNGLTDDIIHVGQSLRVP